ncbi:tRNA pseudouridine(13) synthase TruD [Halobacteriales archaeon SW_7_68_16]|nr:MAG: tRNA pseudouridine(13) synthase TruD [Halobacteriales archaeon SW_7_68_16]
MGPAHERERAVGIAHYHSDPDGIGGRLRRDPEDFRVVEREWFDVEPADAPADAYPHVVLRVRLRNWETGAFAGRLADALGISRERVSWAGTKDRRAVTTQLMSVRGVDPGAVPTTGIDDAEIEVVGRAGRGIHFGDLAGNEFEIVVRDPDRTDTIDAITADLTADSEDKVDDDHTTVAVPNYFGHQRFGSRRPVTHEVGLSIARGDWEAAVRTYVTATDPAEPEDTRAAREFAAEAEPAAALDRFPERLSYERALLHRLDEGGTHREAIEALPTSLQQLFVHAAQSYVFNRIVSERVSRGLSLSAPVAGDTVCFAATDAPPGLTVPDVDRTQAATEDRLSILRRHCERGRAVVTAPLVGTETELATGEPGEIERAVLDDVGIIPEAFALPEPFGSTGTRRAIELRSDLTVTRDPVTFAFALPSGSYATVLLREYLKTDPTAL